METISAAIELQLLTPDTEQEWDRYVRSTPATSLYHLSGWKRVIDRTFGHPTYYLYATQNGQVVGVLPLVFLKSLLFGKFFVSLPYFNYGGVVAETQDVRKRLIEEAIALARKEGAEHIELRHIASHDLALPVKTGKVLMILDLPDDPDLLWKSFKSKLRSQIRRPEREGFTVKFGQLDELDQFYRVFTYKMRDLGTPVYTKQLFENILREFPEQTKICTVYREQTPIASGFLIGFQGMLQIPWAASIRAYDRFGVNMMLYWNILKFACEQGYSQFDFGRSTPDKGTFKFKQQWGAAPVQCYWHYWLANGDDLPEINPHNPKYQLAIAAWQRLPLAVTTWLGPKIVKYIP